MGFVPSRADQDLWLHKLDEHMGYDYIATHVDNIIIVAKSTSKYMIHIEQHFQMLNVTDSPSYYLGNDLVRQGKFDSVVHKGLFKGNVEEISRKYGALAKENLPLKPKMKSELDDSPLVDEAKHKEHQHIIGVCQRLIVAGQFDLTHTISSLSCFAATPQEGRLELARK
eukprot:2688481-Ditylum_brightwellii.AAC.1